MRERFFVSFSIVNNHIVMMQFDILTIFPGVFDGYLNESMIKRGRAKHILNIRIHDIRAFSRDRRKKVDDRPYGGGPGMVMRIEPIARAAEKICLDRFFAEQAQDSGGTFGADRGRQTVYRALIHKIFIWKPRCHDFLRSGAPRIACSIYAF